jgi:hypothetical protein
MKTLESGDKVVCQRCGDEQETHVVDELQSGSSAGMAICSKCAQVYLYKDGELHTVCDDYVEKMLAGMMDTPLKDVATEMWARLEMVMTSDLYNNWLTEEATAFSEKLAAFLTEHQPPKFALIRVMQGVLTTELQDMRPARGIRFITEILDMLGAKIIVTSKPKSDAAPKDMN